MLNILLNTDSLALDLRIPVVSILDAVFIVSPNKVYRGIFKPTTPATHGPTNVLYNINVTGMRSNCR